MLTFPFEWSLRSSPAALWPLVARTDRVNRATGLDAVDYMTTREEGKVARFGEMRGPLNMRLSWREHPYEWVEAQRMSVLREYSSGPLRWLAYSVDLQPDGSGTRLLSTIRVLPRNVLGVAAAKMEIGVRLKRAFTRLYIRMDRHLVGDNSRKRPEVKRSIVEAVTGDPFEEPFVLSGAARQRLDDAAARLRKDDTPEDIVAALTGYVSRASALEVSRVRPLAFARRFGLPEDATVLAFLKGLAAGLLVLRWDLLCPSCRIAAETREALPALRDHGRCDACDLRFDLDPARSIEAIFRPHPTIREVDTGAYCAGGPGHRPHVLAQVNLRSDELFALEMPLAEGTYCIASAGLEPSLRFDVTAQAPARDLTVSLASPAALSPVAAGPCRLLVQNGPENNVVFRLERTVDRADALTARRAGTLPKFVECVPELQEAGAAVGPPL